MKTRITLPLFAAIVISLAAPRRPAVAQSTITFDENGNSSGSFGSLTSGFGTDPLATGSPSFPTATLFYVLPFPVTTGDVQLTEQPTGVSDVIRFEGNRVYFYSDNLDGSDALADVGLPIGIGTPLVLGEVGSEGNDGVAYTPAPGSGLPGDPGASSPTVTYSIQSDVVPEPSSWVAAGLGGALLYAARRRRLGGE
jgi:hypothetical protein